MELKDKVAVVTGSARGLGQAIALSLANQGVNLVLCDLQEPKETQEKIIGLGQKAAAYACDIRSQPSVEKLFSEGAAKFGKIDILVNNAGITKDSLFHKMTEQQMSDVLDVNVKGSFLCAQMASSFFVKQKSGKIINIASIAALGNIGQTNYSASKAAVIGMTRTIALELAKFNINVNAIAPGFFDTAMTQAIPPEVKEKFIQKIPLKRMGKPEEIGNLVCFLASEKASYFTGQTFFIDGGLSVGLGAF
ncbi:MAG: beta-ketoacyl-ACP reductase [Bacteriovoracia bacterium]